MLALLSTASASDYHQTILSIVRGRAPAVSSSRTQSVHHIVFPSTRTLNNCRRCSEYHERLLQAHVRQVRGHLWAH